MRDVRRGFASTACWQSSGVVVVGVVVAVDAKPRMQFLLCVYIRICAKSPAEYLIQTRTRCEGSRRRIQQHPLQHPHPCTRNVYLLVYLSTKACHILLLCSESNETYTHFSNIPFHCVSRVERKGLINANLSYILHDTFRARATFARDEIPPILWKFARVAPHTLRAPCNVILFPHREIASSTAEHVTL